MKNVFGVLAIALLSTMMWAQDPGQAPPPPGGPGGPAGPRMGMHGPRGGFAWWKNSDTAAKLNLTDTQIQQLDQTFYQHRMSLIDEMAAMQKADLKLRELLDADNPDQGQVMSAVDQVLAARGKVERETTMMLLDFRKILTLDQWKQLRAMHPMGPGFGGHMRGRKFNRGQGGPPASTPNGAQSQQ